MNNKLTELVYILDMSGSMCNLVSDTIGGYNSMIARQRKFVEDNFELQANVTTVMFDDEYMLIHDRANIKDIPDITEKEYHPRGMTAMLDAIGKTLVDVGKKLADTPEEERPGLVSVVIITDGMENASKEYTWETIRNMIKEQKEKYSWVFSFIGANIDVDKVTYDLGIDRSMSATYTANGIGTASVYSSLAKGITAMQDACYTVSCTGSGNVDIAATAYSTLGVALDSVE